MTTRTPKGDLEWELQEPEAARLYRIAVAKTEREYRRQVKWNRRKRWLKKLVGL